MIQVLCGDPKTYKFSFKKNGNAPEDEEQYPFQ